MWLSRAGLRPGPPREARRESLVSSPCVSVFFASVLFSFRVLRPPPPSYRLPERDTVHLHPR
jgi:hypothetical protein